MIIMVLSGTVSKRISKGYIKLLSQRMVFVKPSYSDTKAEAIMILRILLIISLKTMQKVQVNAT